jgi:hypothetical protein
MIVLAQSGSGKAVLLSNFILNISSVNYNNGRAF